MNLEEVVIPKTSTYTSIGDYAFQDCSKLKKFYIPDGVKIIPTNTFIGCTALTQIRIPPSVTDMGGFEVNIFKSSPDLTIYCKKDSYAMKYAIKYGIPHVCDDDIFTVSIEVVLVDSLGNFEVDVMFKNVPFGGVRTCDFVINFTDPSINLSSLTVAPVYSPPPGIIPPGSDFFWSTMPPTLGNPSGSGSGRITFKWDSHDTSGLYVSDIFSDGIFATIKGSFNVPLDGSSVPLSILPADSNSDPFFLYDGQITPINLYSDILINALKSGKRAPIVTPGLPNSGDMNGDSVVNLLDLDILIALVLSGSATPAEIAAGDMDYEIEFR